MNSGSQLLLGRHVTGNDGNDAISVSEVEKIRINKLERVCPTTQLPTAMKWQHVRRLLCRGATIVNGQPKSGRLC